MTGDFTPSVLLPLLLLGSGGLAIFLRRESRSHRAGQREWLLEAVWIALTTLLILLTFVGAVAVMGSGGLSIFHLLLACVGALILAFVLRALGRGEVQPLMENIRSSYRRDRQPVGYWLSLAWNSAIGGLLLLAAWVVRPAAPASPAELTCLDQSGVVRAEGRVSACSHWLESPTLDAHDRGYAHDLRAVARLELGDERGAQEDWRRAIAAYGEALASGAGDATLQLNSAMALHQIGASKEARSAYDAYLALEPWDARGYMQRGIASLDEERYVDAAADYTKARDLLPGEAGPLAYRGLTFALAKDAVRAEPDLAAARQLDPSHIVILRGEALLALLAGDGDRALDKLTQALRRDPGDLWSAALRRQLIEARDQGQRQATRT